MEKDIPSNENGENCWRRNTQSDKIDFKIKNVTRDKEEHYIMIKESIQEEGITIIDIYVPNTGTPQYIRQMLTAIKREIVTQ